MQVEEVWTIQITAKARGERREVRGPRASVWVLGLHARQGRSTRPAHLARRNTVAGAGGAARTGWRLERVCAGTSAKRLPSRVYKQHDLPSLNVQT